MKPFRSLEEVLAANPGATWDDLAATMRWKARTYMEWLEQGDQRVSYCKFKPRPDQPDGTDQIESYVNAMDQVSFLIAGNASGKTTASAAKCARFILHHQPPPRRNTPFWILSDTYDQVCDVCWGEKLLGEGHIPDAEIDWDNVSWLDKKAGAPKAVPLRPWPGKPGRNWRLEFRSYEQGRHAMQAKSIGGFWFSEAFALEIFLEVLRGTREYSFPGGQMCEFTAISPELSDWVQAAMERCREDPALRGWKFYHGDTKYNAPNLADGWIDQFEAILTPEQREVRLRGALAGHTGRILPEFNADVHGREESAFLFPEGCDHIRGLDWGASEEHPNAVVWAYRDGLGDWWVYDCYWSTDLHKICRDHAIEVMARSICWGWPRPWRIEGYTNGDGLPHFRPILHNETDFSSVPGFPDAVEKRVAALRGSVPRKITMAQRWGTTYCDHRPNEINEFRLCGIESDYASKDVDGGIDLLKSLLVVNPATHRPKLMINLDRCQRLVLEMRKWRWQRAASPIGRLNPNVARPVPVKRDDDCLDALRYALFSFEKRQGAAPGSISHKDYEVRHGVAPWKRIGTITGNPAIGNGRWLKHKE